MADCSVRLHGPHSQHHLEVLIVGLQELPHGVWQAAFPQQRQWPQLQQLKLGNGRDDQEDDRDEWDDELAAVSGSAVSTEDIERLVGCCPALQFLDIDVWPMTRLWDLSELAGLTALTVQMADEGVVKSLSDLLQLKALQLETELPFSAQGLLHLTTLRQLTYLSVTPQQEPADYDYEEDEGFVELRMMDEDEVCGVSNCRMLLSIAACLQKVSQLQL